MSVRSEYSLAASDLTFGELLRILGRRKWLIFANVILFLLLAALVTFFSPERWSTIVRLEVLGRTQTNPSLVDDPVLQQIITQSVNLDVPTQVELLQSQEVYISTLNYANIDLPNFEEIDSVEKAPKITAQQVQLNNIVQIEVEASSKEDALALRTVLPITFENFIIARIRAELESAKGVAQQQLADARPERDKAQKALNDYLNARQLTSLGDEAGRRQLEADRINERLRQARSEEAAARRNYESRRNSLDQLIREEPTVTEETDVPNRQERIAAERALQAAEAQLVLLQEKFRDDHPAIRAQRSQIALEKDTLAKIPERLKESVTVPNPQIRTLELSVNEALAFWRGAEAALSQAEADAAVAPNDIQDLLGSREEIARLENNLQEKQLELDSKIELASRLEGKSADIRDAVKDATQATAPRQTSPRWAINLALGLLLGLIFGVVVGIARDIALDQVTQPEEAAGLAGAEVLARIPKRARGRAALITDPQKARAFEAYRLLRAGVLSQLERLGGKSLLITSTEEAEGKTVVAGNLGVAMTLDGRRTLLIDGNLREPKLAKLMQAEIETGLDAVLLGQKSFAEAVTQTRIPNLDLLAPSGPLANSTEALASDQMAEIIAEASRLYDVVIVDSPESYTTADARELSRHCTGVLYVVEPQAANKTRMEEAVSLVRQAGSRVIGVAMNKDKGARSRLS
jgi:capsular exopolysaccharide synthesis family protein